jgi:hypothetical protein
VVAVRSVSNGWSQMGQMMRGMGRQWSVVGKR